MCNISNVKTALFVRATSFSTDKFWSLPTQYALRAQSRTSNRKAWFVTQHLWLGDFGKCNRGLRARTLWLCYPKSSVMFPFS